MEEGKKKERGSADIQISSVIPDWARDIPSESIDKDLILIELENDVRQPPGSMSLEALPVASGPSGGGV